MKRLLVLFSLASVLPGGILRAQDPDRAYDLKLRVLPVVGQKTHVSNSESQKMRMAIKVGDQVLQDKSEAQDHSFAGQEEVLKVDGDHATLLKWTFSKAVKSADGKEVPLGFQGKTVLVKHPKDQEAEYTYESGDKLEGEDLDSIKKAFDTNGGKKDRKADELFAPKKPVKVGESWNPPLEAIAQGMLEDGMAEAIDQKSSKCQFTLKSVSERGGALFGKIECVMELAMGQLGPMKLDTPVRMKINGELEMCIDGKIPDGEMKMTMVLKGITTTDAPNGAKVTIDMDMTNKTVAKKKSTP